MHNLQQMMSQMKKMQEELQQRLESLRVEGSAGGGIVTVKMNGNKKVLAVRIDPAAVKESDVEMLQDLVQAAVNEGMRKVDDSLKEMLGGLAGLTGLLPPGLKIPGLF
jgi:DNA-binding YbaB/EbfC family protein